MTPQQRSELRNRIGLSDGRTMIESKIVLQLLDALDAAQAENAKLRTTVTDCDVEIGEARIQIADLRRQLAEAEKENAELREKMNTKYWDAVRDDNNKKRGIIADLNKKRGIIADLRRQLKSLCEHRESYNAALIGFDAKYAGHDYLLAGIDVINRAKAAESQVAAMQPVVEAAEEWRAGKTEDEELFVVVDAYIAARDGAKGE